jgi:hypothetical protein
MKTINKGCIIRLGLILALIVVAFATCSGYLKYARYKWKESAIPEISNYATNAVWVEQEIQTLRSKDVRDCRPSEQWLSKHMILMKNGDWLVYKNHCYKESPILVRDIFLAKGSNGKWYNSSFHFCINMCVLANFQDYMPPNDLASFVRLYNLAEFDGHSVECLSQTKHPDMRAISDANQAMEVDGADAPRYDR